MLNITKTLTIIVIFKSGGHKAPLVFINKTTKKSK